MISSLKVLALRLKLLFVQIVEVSEDYKLVSELEKRSSRYLSNVLIDFLFTFRFLLILLCERRLFPLSVENHGC